MALALAFLSILQAADVKFIEFAERVGIVDKVEALGGRTATQNTFIRFHTWTGNVPELTAAGLFGGTMESVIVSLPGLTGNEQIETRVFMSGGLGWRPWVQSGQPAGIVNGNVHIQAIQIRLVNIPGWSIYYRVHIRNDGWSPWQGNGQTAGNTTTGIVDAVQIYVIQNAIPSQNPYTSRHRVAVLYHDQTAVNLRPFIDHESHHDFIHASAGIRSSFNFFIQPTNRSELAVVLNGGQQPVGTCPRGNLLRCNSGCGSLANCRTEHHRNASTQIDNLDTIWWPSGFFRVGVIGHVMCRYAAPNHDDITVLGVARPTSRSTISTTTDVTSTVDGVSIRARIMQHELGHILSDMNDCAASCIMNSAFANDPFNSAFNRWCSPHGIAIGTRIGNALV